jgi:hypothetical protein
MSYFIANSIKYNQELDRIEVKGGSNNVVPRYNDWTHYENKDGLLRDLISGSIELKSISKLAKLCLNSVSKIKILHQQQFGSRQNKYPYPNKSINPYSLFMISNYSYWNKEKTLINTRDLSYIGKKYHQEKLDEADAMEQVWDEANQFWNDILTIFFNDIQIPRQKAEVTQTQLF